MTGEGRSEAAREELARSVEELRAGDALLALDLARIAVTRAYFAVFHAARALLYANNLEPKTHEGVLQLVSLHFVKTGVLSVDDARTLARLQRYRAEADYGDALIVDAKAAAEDLVAARALCERVRALVSPP